MANLRSAMDAAFWDFNIASPQTLNGYARAVPGEPFPLDGSRASRALRVQQLSSLSRGFPLGLIPSYSSHKDLGGLCLQSVLFQREFGDSWLALLGQFCPMKLISSIKAELSAIQQWEPSAFKNVAKSFLDKSPFSAGFCSRVALAASSFLIFTAEGHGERKGCRTKASFVHTLPFHAIILEAAAPELFIDQHGLYWDLPLSLSLDLSSLVYDSGLRYRFGLHKTSGDPQAISATNGNTPTALMPGICAKAAFSYEKRKDLWRERESAEDVIEETYDDERYWSTYEMTTYDMRLREPHASLSATFGGTCAALLKNGLSTAVESLSAVKTSLDADFFSSLCFTYQHGKYEKLYGDLTRLDARLDLCSGVGLAKRVSNKFRNATGGEENTLSLPRINVIFQQQVAGPVVFRVDSRVAVDGWGGGRGPRVEDCTFSLNYALRLLISGKVVAWYSPMRKEGMVELRLFEF